MYSQLPQLHVRYWPYRAEHARQRSLAQRVVTGHLEPTQKSGWSIRVSKDMPEETWTNGYTHNLDRHWVHENLGNIKEESEMLRQHIQQVMGWRVPKYDFQVDYICAGEVGYHYDDYIGDNELFLAWCIDTDADTELVVDGVSMPFNRGDWVVFDSYNLHSVRKKARKAGQAGEVTVAKANEASSVSSSSSQEDSIPLHMVYALTSIPMGKRWCDAVGIQIKKWSDRRLLKYPDFCEKTGLVTQD